MRIKFEREKNMREDEIKKKKNTILKMISNKINNN